MRFKRVLGVTVFALCVLALLVAPVAANPEACKVGSPGYWKTHPEAWAAPWYTDEIFGLSQDQVIDFLESPTRGDKSLTLFRAYAAAKLNQWSGCATDCGAPGPDRVIEDVIDNAGGWLLEHGLGTGVKANSEAWQNGGEEKYNWLDKYNNGELCVPARD